MSGLTPEGINTAKGQFEAMNEHVDGLLKVLPKEARIKLTDAVEAACGSLLRRVEAGDEMSMVVALIVVGKLGEAICQDTGVLKAVATQPKEQ